MSQIQWEGLNSGSPGKIPAPQTAVGVSLGLILEQTVRSGWLCSLVSEIPAAKQNSKGMSLLCQIQKGHRRALAISPRSEVLEFPQPSHTCGLQLLKRFIT